MDEYYMYIYILYLAMAESMQMQIDDNTFNHPTHPHPLLHFD